MGLALPSTKNFKYLSNDGVQGSLKLSLEIISPDNGGRMIFVNLTTILLNWVILQILSFLLLPAGRLVA